ncbi:MAG: alanine transaminase [Deltaproteobacteria bacterium CG11_big_fil_rev_8_21_14_0_20_47_16]|nr:MAG: alanine transaminase [Deltaproteobacteria bacterium CG11_big_fil_rev_8_21_14_0_20_47_16]
MKFSRPQQLPPYILGEIVRMMREARKQGEDVINLGMGNPDLPTPEPIVEKMIEATRKPHNHRYSLSRGIPNLRRSICNWYRRHHDVKLDVESQCIVTMGAKEGLSHLILAITEPGDVVLVPNPSYPIHIYSMVIAGAHPEPIIATESLTIADIEAAIQRAPKPPKGILLSFPSNPTGQTIDKEFFTQVIALAKQHNMWVIHDFAYAHLVFDGYRAPSILEIPGALDVAVEITSLSKSHSMPGWRVGFVCGNPDMVAALAKIKSYYDYGMFQPIQIAAIVALDQCEQYIDGIVDIYKSRRDELCDGLNRIGWNVAKPNATMFVWAKIPEPFQSMGSMEFCKLLLNEGKVAASPGVGFGEYGEGYVRFALVENEDRIQQAVQGIKRVLRSGPKKS